MPTAINHVEEHVMSKGECGGVLKGVSAPRGCRLRPWTGGVVNVQLQTRSVGGHCDMRAIGVRLRLRCFSAVVLAVVLKGRGV